MKTGELFALKRFRKQCIYLIKITFKRENLALQEFLCSYQVFPEPKENDNI